MRNYLKVFRKERGLLQTETATMIGVSPTYYNYIEAGTRQVEMSYSMMVKLAKAFEVSIQTIIDAETEYVERRRDFNIKKSLTFTHKVCKTERREHFEKR